jgi:hypothetical protein
MDGAAIIVVVLAVAAALLLALVLHSRMSAALADVGRKHRAAQSFFRQSGADSAALLGEAAKLPPKIQATREYLETEMNKAGLPVPDRDTPGR